METQSQWVWAADFSPGQGSPNQQKKKKPHSTDSSPAGHQSSELLPRQRADLISPLNRTQPLTSVPSKPRLPQVVAMVTVKRMVVVVAALQDAEPLLTL